jgi:hypothetical protein
VNLLVELVTCCNHYERQSVILYWIILYQKYHD